MNQKVKIVITVLVLIAVLVLAYFGYRALSDRYQPAPADGTTAAGEQSTARQKAPDFTVVDADGKEVSLSSFAGKPVLINFWATWCGPCRSELPAFEQMYRTYGDRVAFLMVNLTDGYRETQAGVQTFLEQGAYTFPVLFDTSFKAQTAYAVSSIPVTVAVGADGTVLARHLGTMSEQALTEMLRGMTGDT